MGLGLENGAVGELVADRNSFFLCIRAQKLDVAKAVCERDLGLVVQVLPRKNQHGIFVKGVLDTPPGGVVHAGEIDAGDRGAQRGVEARDGRFHEILPHGGCRYRIREPQYEKTH